nr:transposon Ty3-I Gag-Pol polyprotein [Tanacetum cinerariifolium]
CNPDLARERTTSIYSYWDDLVLKFINQFIPSSKTTSLCNEITNFQQRFDESFSEAWDRFKDLLRACPHYGFLELHQLDTFYNALNSKDQDSLNSAAGVNTNASTFGVSPDVAELKEMVKALLLDKKGQNQSPAPVKAVEESYVTCGGAHSYCNCPATDGNFVNSNATSTSSSGTLPNNMIANLKSDLKAITTRSGVSYDGPQIPPPAVENEPEVTKDTVNPTNNGNTKDVQPQAVQSKSKPVNFEPAIASVSASKPNPKPSILYPSRRNDERNRIAECLALADLGASINLMPFSVWKRLSLPDLTPMCMTLELADRLISRSVGVVEDVYVKVGSFHFPTDFVVVDFNADPRVPLIPRRSFLKTGRALIDVFEVKRIDVIDMACEEYSLEVLGFSDTISSGNPTPYHDPIVSATFSTLTQFGNSDFLLKEVDAFLAIEDEPTSFEFHQPYLDPEGDVLLLEAFLNDDPSSPPLNQRNYMPEVRKELKICEAKTDKSSVDEPPVVELKALPPHLDVHSWKLSDIKGINPEFCTHKILMEEDFTLAVQHQRRVNPKIHDVIKQEVIKLLDAGLIYPISDSPWVSPVHCVPKKGGFTVVKNEDNELILTRLVTGWRVCIDYHKLNEATQKDHFPLPFMGQMLERLTGNQYYCFLDGFFGYFQIPIDPIDQEKTTFTCPCGTPMTRLLEKDTLFIFSQECVDVFQTLKRKLTEAPILIALDWDMPFELMSDASDFAIRRATSR